MNKRRLREMGEALVIKEYPPHYVEFDMNSYCEPSINKCGSAGCIAGLAVAMFAPVMWEEVISVHKVAKQLLDITDKLATALFAPPNVNLIEVTREEAADAIDKLLEEGWPSWNLYYENRQEI